MSPRQVDVTVGAHSFLDALSSISFTLGCGCRTRPIGGHDDEDVAVWQKNVGSTFPCSKHGEQVITRSTQRLTGWKPARRFR
jgi:hypothetical protein